MGGQRKTPEREKMSKRPRQKKPTLWKKSSEIKTPWKKGGKKMLFKNDKREGRNQKKAISTQKHRNLGKMLKKKTRTQPKKTARTRPVVRTSQRCPRSKGKEVKKLERGKKRTEEVMTFTWGGGFT